MRASLTLPHAAAASDRDRAEAAGWLGGASAALDVLMTREPALRERAVSFAMSMLSSCADPADWASAGLSAPSLPHRAAPRCRVRLPVGHKAVLRLAHSAMSLRVSGLESAQRPKLWDRLASFLRSHVTDSDQSLHRVVESGLHARVAMGDMSAEVLDGLAIALERHRALDGEDSYAADVARINLALACGTRSAGDGLAQATQSAAAEAARCAERYGTRHPLAIQARTQWVDLLVNLADTEVDPSTRISIARHALAQANVVRMAWDRLLGVTSGDAIRSRGYEGQALLMMGDLEKARVCLECALAFSERQTGVRDDQCRGVTLWLLARVYAAAGDGRLARDTGEQAVHVLGRTMPRSAQYRRAEAFLHSLSAGAG